DAQDHEAAVVADATGGAVVAAAVLPVEVADAAVDGAVGTTEGVAVDAATSSAAGAPARWDHRATDLLAIEEDPVVRGRRVHRLAEDEVEAVRADDRRCGDRRVDRVVHGEGIRRRARQREGGGD